MSKETWLEEYYPVPASAAEAQTNDRAAIEHSLHKWRGLRPDVLEAHNLYPRTSRLIADACDGRDVIEVDGSSCALCEMHIQNECKGCPLYDEKTNSRCDSEGREYRNWLYHKDPEPMIAALEAALEKELEKE